MEVKLGLKCSSQVKRDNKTNKVICVYAEYWSNAE